MSAPVGEYAVTILFLLLLLDSQLNRTQIAAIDGCHVANVTVRGKRQGLFIIRSVELILLLPSSQWHESELKVFISNCDVQFYY